MLTAVLSFFIFDILIRLIFSCNISLCAVIFSLVWSVILGSLIMLIPKKLRAAVYCLFISVLTLYIFAQKCYYYFFSNLFSIKTVTLAREGLSFVSTARYIIDKKLIVILIIIVIMCIKMWTTLSKSEKVIPKKLTFSLFSVSIVILLFLPNILGEPSEDTNSPRFIYDNMSNLYTVFSNTGTYEFLSKDIRNTVKKSIFKKSKAEIDSYFNNIPEHTDNEYTGIFKDKNLILIMLESMDGKYFNEKITPNIINIMNKSISFSNFYAPIFGDGATFNTEFAINTGLYSPRSGSAAFGYTKNTFTYTLARLFSENGYSANSFHMNNPEFYNRGIMHKSWGYEKYVCYKDYVSDEEALIDDIAVKNDEIFSQMISDRFFDFMITYSPHLDYNGDYTSDESFKRHPDIYDETLSERENNFNAKIKLTDDMLGKLLERLEEENRLKDTVIIGITDHYAYGLEKSSEPRTTPFFIYSQNSEPFVCGKICSSIDVMPTIINLFGIKTENKFIGNDIFDEDYDGYAYFADYSYIADSEINTREKIQVNEDILDSDYYK